jgi:hypothetical protein
MYYRRLDLSHNQLREREKLESVLDQMSPDLVVLVEGNPLQ